MEINRHIVPAAGRLVNGRTKAMVGRFMVCASAAGACLAASGYVPEPQPVKSAVEITALYYPGTEQMSEWDMVEIGRASCRERV